MKAIFNFLIFIGFSLTALAQPRGLVAPTSKQSVFLNSKAEHKGKFYWQMAKVSEVKGLGASISSSSYNSNTWSTAVVPGTVLTSLVLNNVYPDPYFGDVNLRKHKIIPDIADVGREFYHYWFRTTFKVPPSFTGKRTWIKLHGINYRSEIWFNGKKLGKMAGMFNGQSFDVTELLNRSGVNALAVDVSPVDVPGQSGLKKERRTGALGENHNGGDGLIGENTTMLMSAGWDFTFPDGVRDRNTGIWREVELYTTNDVVLANPFVITDLPLPDTTSAKQTISVEVTNTTSIKQTGLLKGSIAEGNITFSKTVNLGPGETKIVVFDPTSDHLLLFKNPKLWWPINKGNQHLYHLSFAFIQGKVIGHQISSRFGIREISSDQDTPDKSRRFLVNGYPVFIRGTNWIPEAMLRNSPKRTLAELRYTKQAGLNLIRLWGGGIAESDYFYDLCDELGFLVWSEFWLTGDSRYPTDKKLYLQNMEYTVKRLRTHASQAYYVSSNESTEIEGAPELVARLDPSLGYQMQSECCGVHDGSPYKYENPMQYFENTASPRGSRVDGFNPEYGTPCLPTVESLREMMPKKDLWPINESVWNYLDGGGFHQITTKYRDAVNQFGTSNSIEEFATKAQFVGALNYRAIWEVWNYNKFGYGDRFASGFLFWYHNSPVRQTGGRMYDWSLEPTAALYYSQNGLEPIHAQFDYLKNTVSVYNDFRRAFSNYTVTATIYNIKSETVSEQKASVNIPADGLVKDAIKLDFPENISQVHFIKLVVRDEQGKVIADSFYWRSKDAYKGAWTLTGPAVSGFEQINQLGTVNLRVQPIIEAPGKMKVTLSNPSKTLSFFTQLKLQDTKGKSIRPTRYTDNFFSLLPGESKTVAISYERSDVPGDEVRLITTGFNASSQTHSFKLKPR